MERYEPELNGHKLQRGTVILLIKLFFFRNLKRKNLNKSEMTNFSTGIGGDRKLSAESSVQ